MVFAEMCSCDDGARAAFVKLTFKSRGKGFVLCCLAVWNVKVWIFITL